MSIISTGDMSRHLLLQRHQTQAKSDLSRLTQELASGQHQDMGKALRGDFTALAGIERGLRLIESYKNAASEAEMFTSAGQAALQTIQTNLDDMAPGLLSATGSGTLQQMETMAASAPDRLSAMIGALNQSAAGRALFAGAESDADALISPDALMSLLQPIAAGAIDAADLIATLDSWFMDPGGGFETQAFLGSADTPPKLLVAEGETLNNPLTALDSGLRKSLMGMALAGLVSTGATSFDDGEKRQLLETAALQMATGNNGVTALRADLGHVEGRIEAAKVRNESTRSLLLLERNRLTVADPYDTATALQEAESRLEGLYLLTSRLSRLSLTEYL